MICSDTALGQGALANGLAHDGAISAAGEVDNWTVAANQGDRIIVQIAELSGGAGFAPRIEAVAPDGTLMGAATGGVAAGLTSVSIGDVSETNSTSRRAISRSATSWISCITSSGELSYGMVIVPRAPRIWTISVNGELKFGYVRKPSLPECLLLAQNGHGAMSDLSPLCAPQRTWRKGPIKVTFNSATPSRR